MHRAWLQKVAEWAFCITVYGSRAKGTGKSREEELSVDEVCFCSSMDPVRGTHDI